MNNGRTVEIPESEGQNIAETIYDQLKATNREIFEMLGVTKMVSAKDSLKLKLSGIQHINTIIIKLDEGRDLYDIEFWNCRILNREPYIQNYLVTERKGIFWEEMAEVILRTVRQ